MHAFRWFIATAALATAITTAGCAARIEGGDTYQPCASNSDCARAEDRCTAVRNGVVDFFGSMCTHTCASGSDCPTLDGRAGVCAPAYGSGATPMGMVCYAGCAGFDSDADCEVDWYCAGEYCLPLR